MFIENKKIFKIWDKKNFDKKKLIKKYVQQQQTNKQTKRIIHQHIKAKNDSKIYNQKSLNFPISPAD